MCHHPNASEANHLVPALGPMRNIRHGDEILLTVMEQPNSNLGAHGSCCLHVPVRCCAMPPHRKPRADLGNSSKTQQPNRLVRRVQISNNPGLPLNPIERSAKLSHDARPALPAVGCLPKPAAICR